jgi:hypothetical protein
MTAEQNALPECFGVCYPSNAEGFVPIIETFASGLPYVVLDDSSCFPEVAQNAALI